MLGAARGEAIVEGAGRPPGGRLSVRGVGGPPGGRPSVGGAGGRQQEVLGGHQEDALVSLILPRARERKSLWSGW